MADIRTFFACIAQFFGVVWTSFIGLFVSKWRVDSKPCDIEAGISASIILEKGSTAVCNGKQGVEAGDGLCASSTDEFVDIDLNTNNQSITISEKKTRAMNFEHPTKVIKFDQPSRRPSRRMSAVDPVKSRILDTTLKNVQDRATNVVKPVIITPGTLMAVACTAQVEYYHGTIIEPSSAQIEYFNDHISSTAKVEYFHQPISGEKIEVSGLPTSESSEFSVVNLEYKRKRGGESRPANEPVLKTFTINVKDVDGPCVESSVSWAAHTEINPKGNYHESQFDYSPREILFTPLPERKSRRVKEMRARERESLFDLIAQFPDIPRHTPPGPEVSAIDLENVEESPRGSRSVENAPQSPTESERSTSSSGSSYYGLIADDTTQTSAPGSPELANSSFSVLGKDHIKHDLSDNWNTCPSVGSHELDHSWRSNTDLSGKPLECPGPVFVNDVLPEGVVPVTRVLTSADVRALSPSESGPHFYSKMRNSTNELVGECNSQTGFYEEEPTEDRFIIESHKAAGCAILSAPQNDLDVSMDSLLGQLEASSFDSTYRRPQSVVWFVNKTLRDVIPTKVIPSSVPVDYSQPSIAPLRIVKKNKIRPAEVAAEVIEAENAAQVEQDEVLLQEYVRWEESRQAGLKAFREAVVADDDFYDLFYRDSCRYSQSSLATDVLGLTGDFAATLPSSSDSEMALNECPPFDDIVESEESMEMSSSFDLSNSTGVTGPEEHASGPLYEASVKAFGSSDLPVDEDEDSPAWVAAPDSKIDRIANKGENVRWSASLELDAYTN